MSTCVSSSSSSSLKSGMLRRNSWITEDARPSDAPQQVPELVLLGLQVAPARVGGGHLERQASHDLEAVALQPDELPRVVRHEPDLVEPQLVEDLRADPVVALVGLEAQRLVGGDRVVTLVLELVGHDLVHEADAAALLAEVQQHAPAGLADRLQREVELRAAVAPRDRKSVV